MQIPIAKVAEMGDSPGSTTGEAILAAGGIVWRSDADERVAVVHRPQHDDWALPKGKLKDGETSLQAAEREAREETGCEVAAGVYIGAIAYTVAGRPKVVQFGEMESDGSRVRELADDVDSVEWLTVEEAAAKLSHPLERSFLTQAAALVRRATVDETRRRRAEPPPRPSAAALAQSTIVEPTSRRLVEALPPPSAWKRFFNTSTARLHQSITSYRHELQRIITNYQSQDKTSVDAAVALLASAARAIQEKNSEAGWHCFKAATRMDLFLLSPDERRVRAIRVLSEARQKLGSWRKDAIEQILVNDGAIVGNPPAEHVAAAAQLLHEHEDNTYNLLRIRRRQLLVLGLCAMALLALLAALASPAGDLLNLLQWRGLLYFAAAGALGASVSGLLRIGEPRRAVRIPDELGAFSVLIGRLAVGAAVAIVLVALWRAGFFSLAGIQPDSPEFATALAFAAGFSERLAQGALDRLAGGGTQEAGATPATPSSRQ